jgi:hypothetical protein
MSDDEPTRESKDPRETPLAGPGPEPEDKRRELSGDEPEGDQVAWVERDEVDQRQADLTPTELYMGELEGGRRGRGSGVEGLTERGMRDGETANPAVAAEEGMTWVPPMDPPTVASDDPQGAGIAAGFGDSALSEPYDQDHATASVADEDELSARVREALRADSATNRFAEHLAIGSRGSTVALRGVVDEVDDSDSVVDVASRVAGVDEVIDELDVRALEEGEPAGRSGQRSAGRVQ